jgi:Lon protease-like protein
MKKNIEQGTMSEVLLPLFPLQVVLLPNSILPLHIFEERYKKLISECLVEGKEFGINLAKDNEVAKVGCTAVITNLVKRYEDGRMDILVQGHMRYLLGSVVSSATLYSVGHVTFLAATEEDVDGRLAAETVRLHNQLVEIVYGNRRFALEVDESNPMLSFMIAQKAGMELTQRQALLESNSENERLSVLRQYFIEVIPKLERLGEVERVIKSDGYIIN